MELGNAGLVTHRSVVNTWNCDEMGHMNVRFYISKADIGTAHLFNLLGLGPRTLAEAGWRLRTIDHHVRFLRELHVGMGLYIQTYVLAITETAIRLCHVVRKSSDHSLSATLSADIELIEKQHGTRTTFPEEIRSRASEILQPLPEYAAPRGLSMAPPAIEPTLTLANQLGLFEIFQGIVEPSLCDKDGYMKTLGVMAAASDGISNWFSPIRREEASEGEKISIGGAAVEYRIFYYRSGTVGNLLTLRSGMVEVGNKTLRHVHWLLDAETGVAIASAQAISVVLDLVKRRAIAVPETARYHYQSLVKPELALLMDGC